MSPELLNFQAQDRINRSKIATQTDKFDHVTNIHDWDCIISPDTTFDIGDLFDISKIRDQIYFMNIIYTNDYQIVLTHILENIERLPSYFAGGSLCVDLLNEGKSTKCLMFNLSETVSIFGGDWKRLLNIKNSKLVFKIYKKYKGETEYYKQKFSESTIQYLQEYNIAV